MIRMKLSKTIHPGGIRGVELRWLTVSDRGNWLACVPLVAGKQVGGFVNIAPKHGNLLTSRTFAGTLFTGARCPAVTLTLERLEGADT